MSIPFFGIIVGFGLTLGYVIGVLEVMRIGA